MGRGARIRRRSRAVRAIVLRERDAGGYELLVEDIVTRDRQRGVLAESDASHDANCEDTRRAPHGYVDP
jgi:hypothetical protein